MPLRSLLVAAERDPMVPLNTLRPWLDQASPSLEVHLSRAGGHVGFPASLDLRQNAPLGLEPQVIKWLLVSCIRSNRHI